MKCMISGFRVQAQLVFKIFSIKNIYMYFEILGKKKGV